MQGIYILGDQTKVFFFVDLINVVLYFLVQIYP